MKTFSKYLIALMMLLVGFVQAQVATPPPPPVVTPPPAPPAVSEVDHCCNYKITMQSSDSESGESIYLSLKNKEDRYLASGRFPKRFRADLLTYISGVLGEKRNSSSNFDQWVAGSEEDAVYKVTLKEKSVVISLDKAIASSRLVDKIGDLGIGIKEILAEEDEEAEVERLERDADRLRRDAERMQREAQRIRDRAQREADRLLREADQTQREAQRKSEMEQRAADRALRDADRYAREADLLAREADVLAREADRALSLSAHKGGMDSTVREVLRKPSTKYDASNAQNRNGWTWPAFQQDLILSLEGDGLKGEDNEFVFISDYSGIYVNGIKMNKEQELAYRDLFKRHGFDKSEHFTFYKLYDHIAVINSGVELEAFFKELKAQGEINSLSKPITFQINGDSLKKDGVLQPTAKLKTFNALLNKHNIIPVPGKVLAIEKKGNYLLGYKPDKNTIIGTWVMN